MVNKSLYTNGAELMRTVELLQYILQPVTGQEFHEIMAGKVRLSIVRLVSTSLPLAALCMMRIRTT